MKIKGKKLFDLRYRFDYINLSLISKIMLELQLE